MRKAKFLLIIALSMLLLVFLFILPPKAPAPAGAQEGNANEIIFTIPIGKEGVQYEGENVPEMLTWGPAAFTVAPDGSFWIADTVGNRLLHYSSKGNLLHIIKLDGHVVGAGDLEATASDILVLSQASVPPKVVRLSLDGTVVASYELPEGLRLEDGLSGIALGDKGEVVVEREGGAFVHQLVDAEGKFAPRPLEGYIHCGRLYRARPADLTGADTTRGNITAGNTNIEVVVPHDLGGLRILGFGPDGSFYVIVEEVTVNGAIKVDQTVRHYNAAGKLLGVARVPIAEYYTYVAQNLAVGPDGAVYALVTRPDRVEVQRLRFSKELKSILPAVLVETNVQESESKAIAPLSCRSRDMMISVSSGYVNNSKYLDSTNTDGLCPGRCKPRYINGPGTYPSVPYDWGGWDTVNDYNSYMYPNTYQAGDAPRTDCTATREDCSRGTDCSGFVSRCWGLSEKHRTCPGTPSLENVSCQLKRVSCLKRGDILIKCDVHVILFNNNANNGIYGSESTTYNSYDRVVYIFSSWSRLSDYLPRRYCNVCTYTCIDPACVVQPTPCQ